MSTAHAASERLATIDPAIIGDDVTSRRQREKVEMLSAYLKRIPKLDRLRLRSPNGAKDEVRLAATARNLRTMAKLIPMQTHMAPA